MPYGFRKAEAGLTADPEAQAIIDRMRALRRAGKSLRGCRDEAGCPVQNLHTIDKLTKA